MAVNKVQYGNQTIMDITDTSATPNGVVEGQIFYSAAGTRSTGTLGDATQSTHGLMSATDKTKLDAFSAASTYAPIASPTFTTSITLGSRSENSTIGANSVVMGSNSTSSGEGSLSHGITNTASGPGTYTGGYYNTASNYGSHAEGVGNSATGYSSHAEGNNTSATGTTAHAEGYSTSASGNYSHAQGNGTIAASAAQFVGGKFNVSDTQDTYAEIIGNGIDTNTRKNIRVLDWNGNQKLKGDLYVGCNDDSSNGSKVATETYVTTAIGNAAPSAATQSAAGLMSSSDKVKLDNIDASTYAPKASPELTGIPTAPTAISGTNTTQLATTAFVQNAISQIPISYDSNTKTLEFDLVGGNGLQTQINVLSNNGVNLKNSIEALITLLNHVAYTDTNGNNYVAAVSNALYPALSSISVTFNLGNNLIRESNSLNDLKQYLTVTATYNNGTTAVLNNTDYTLSGTIALASDTYDKTSQTIVVTYGNKTATFNVNVYNAITANKVTLPSGYTQLVMIYNNYSGCYINTGIKDSQSEHAEYGIQAQSSGATNGNNMHVLSSNRTWFPYFRQGNSGARNFQYNYHNQANTATGLTATWEPNINYTIEAFLPEVKINNIIQDDTITNSGASGDSEYNFYIFARCGSSGTPQNHGKLRIFYIKMYDSQNELIRNFIPCKNSSNVAGLYDLVTSEFYSSASEVPCLAGEVIV